MVKCIVEHTLSTLTHPAETLLHPVTHPVGDECTQWLSTRLLIIEVYISDRHLIAKVEVVHQIHLIRTYSILD